MRQGIDAETLATERAEGVVSETAQTPTPLPARLRPLWSWSFPWVRRRAGEAAVPGHLKGVAALQATCEQAWAHLELVWQDGPGPFVLSSIRPNSLVPPLAYGLALAAGGSGSSRGQALLIDADLLERPLRALVGDVDRPGLADALSSKVPLERLIQPLSPRLAVLPAGMETASRVDTLSAGKMKPLLEEARSKFVHVIVLAPPISQGADAIIVAAQVGDMVLAVSADTAAAEAEQAQASLAACGARIRGLLYLDRSASQLQR